MEQVQTLFGLPAMASIFSADSHVGSLLAFEAALARAQARVGVIPAAAADAIASACRIDLFDVPQLYRDAVSAGTVAIPLVKALTASVEGEHGRYVHWGVTSQDAIDSAMMIQIREGVDLLIAWLIELAEAFAALAEEHRRTPMIGRTLLQQALPITFGLKAVRWLSLVTRQVQRLDALRSESFVVQFGGAVGTLAPLGNDGVSVMESLASELGLNVPDLPWHTERDRIADIAGAVGVVAGAMAKIAGDIVLLSQTEVGELSATPVVGKGGSSAMPHKRNPVDATFAIASARLAMGQVPLILNAMVQEHERGVGGWQLEWAALPALFDNAAGAVSRVQQAVDELVVDSERMRANLDVTGGLMMAESLMVALSQSIGRPDAFRLVESVTALARDEKRPLRDVALANERIRSILSLDGIDRALDPMAYLGSTDLFIDRSLAAYQTMRDGR